MPEPQMTNMKTAAIILNYNDAKGTVDAVRRINGFSCFDDIVVVDNASTDDSAELIAAAVIVLNSTFDAQHEHVHFIRSDRNGGYGYGNNLGVRYAAYTLGAELAVIANPDAVFNEQLIAAMQDVFTAHKDAATAGAVMHAVSADDEFSYNELIASGWKRRSLLQHVLNAGPVSRRLFKTWINYSPDYYNKASADAVQVHAVHGSLLMVSVPKFLSAGGYDEHIFLYCEENVLAEKLYRSGFKSFLLKLPYQHEGSVSITGSGLKAVQRQRIRNTSELYFYGHYLGCSRIMSLPVRIFQAFVLMETCIAAMLHLF